MTKEMIEMLEQFELRYDEINESPRDNEIKSIRMAALMTDMETAFQIPILGVERIEAFKRAFPEVLSFYREVSFARAIWKEVNLMDKLPALLFTASSLSFAMFILIILVCIVNFF